MRPQHFDIEWENEDEFVNELCDKLINSKICSKTIKGTKLTDDRLTEFREVTNVEFDEPHQDMEINHRPDIRVHYKGDELPLVYDRSLSNPFYIECKPETHMLLKNAVQGLKYKWKNGETEIKKYSGDSVGMTSPEAIYDFQDKDLRVEEREMWHLGMWFIREIDVSNLSDFVDKTVGMTYNEDELILFKSSEYEENIDQEPGLSDFLD